MKNKTIKPTRSRFNVLRQICNHIPQGEVSKIARETGVEDKSRSFSPWSHTVSLLDAQLTHCIGLNDLCDSLQLHSGALSTIRGASAPSRNGLSHANRERPAAMAERLFWRTLNHLKQQSPGFGTGKRRGPAFDRQHDTGTGSQLHGLGQASAAQSCGQDAHAIELAESFAQLRHCGYRCRA